MTAWTPLVKMPISLHGSNGPQSVPAAPLSPTLAWATLQTMADPKKESEERKMVGRVGLALQSVFLE